MNLQDLIVYLILFLCIWYAGKHFLKIFQKKKFFNNRLWLRMFRVQYGLKAEHLFGKENKKIASRYCRFQK